MARTATIQARIDPEIKTKVQRIPNELTAATLRKSEEGKELNEVGNVDELFQELES